MIYHTPDDRTGVSESTSVWRCQTESHLPNCQTDFYYSSFSHPDLSEYLTKTHANEAVITFNQLTNCPLLCLHPSLPSSHLIFLLRTSHRSQKLHLKPSNDVTNGKHTGNCQTRFNLTYLYMSHSLYIFLNLSQLLKHSPLCRTQTNKSLISRSVTRTVDSVPLPFV